jgi:hypothetical protein
MSETYSVDSKQSKLLAGRKQRIEIVVRYHRSQQPAAKLKYRVEFSAPGDVTLTPASWDLEQNLTTNDAGFNYSGLISVDVAADAAPGDREVKVIITPAHGPTSTSKLKLQVTRNDG